VPGVEARRGGVDVPIEGDGAAVGQRVRVARLGVDPPQAVALERHPREDGRRGGGGVDGREGVVPEARQRQLLGADGTAGTVGGLQHRDPPPGLGEPDRGGQPVGTGPDDDGVAAHAARRGTSSWRMRGSYTRAGAHP
jgi:hypothetical protein